MERNTLLAIVLSAVIFFAYQAIFVPPVQHAETSMNTQNNSVQEPETRHNLKDLAAARNNDETKKPLIKPTNYNIQSTNIDLSYIDMGGSLHNIDFSKNNQFPITDVLSIEGLESAPYIGKKLENNIISLIFNDKNRQIIKTFKFEKPNIIKVNIQILNTSEMSILNKESFTAFKLDASDPDPSLGQAGGRSRNSRESSLFEYSIYSKNRIFRKGNAIKFNDKNYKQEAAAVVWAGFRDHYNTLIVKPEFETKGYEIKADSDQQLKVSIMPKDKNLAPGESVKYDFTIYAGPQDPWIMKKYGKSFEKIVAFSGFSIIEWISQGIYYTIPVFHNIFKSWGFAIILVSVLIYGMTYPLTMKSMMSMRKMQEIQPKITALRDRYKNDPQKLNVETIEIYRREKINPLGGCLPFLVQMPFFMALYQILWRAQYFQGKGFLWIQDLSQPDRLIILPFYLPLIGNEINILPVLTGCIMFVQQKISSKNMIVTDEQQAMQQKMMMYVLPVMMTWMFYKFASSWAIYFLVFYILSTATQWKIAQMTGKK